MYSFACAIDTCSRQPTRHWNHSRILGAEEKYSTADRFLYRVAEGMCIPPFTERPDCRWSLGGRLAAWLFHPLRMGHETEVRSWEPAIQADVQAGLGAGPLVSVAGDAWRVFQADCLAGRELGEDTASDHVHNTLLAVTTFVAIVQSTARADLIRQFATVGHHEDAEDAYQEALVGLWERLRP